MHVREGTNLKAPTLLSFHFAPPQHHIASVELLNPSLSLSEKSPFEAVLQSVALISNVAVQVSQEPVFVPAQGFERFSSKAGILLEVLFDPPKKLTHEQAIRLSVKDHARLWKVQPIVPSNQHPPTAREDEVSNA